MTCNLSFLTGSKPLYAFFPILRIDSLYDFQKPVPVIFRNNAYCFSEVPIEINGKEKEYAMLSASPRFDRIDSGEDELFNRILWFAAKGAEPYPKRMTLSKRERTDDDDE